MERPSRLIGLSGIIAAVLGLLAGFLGGRLAAPPAPQISEASASVQAKQFLLVDQAGRQRGRWEVDAQGVARLALLGSDAAAPMVSLTATPQGEARLELGGDRVPGAVVLHANPQGSQGVDLYHDGKVRLGLEMPKNGAAAITFYHDGNRLITLGLSQQDDPQLIFSGTSQKTALELVAKKTGDRSLSINGRDGTPRLVLGLKDDKKAALGLFDRRGKTRVALMDEPSLILLKGGKLVGKRP